MIKKRKILFVMNSLYGGGAEKVFQTLLNNLSKEKYDISVISINENKIDTSVYKSKFKYSYIFSGGNSFINKIVNKIKLFLYYHTSPEFFYRLFIKEKYDVEVAFIEGYATRFVSGSNNLNSRKYAWVHTDLQTNPWTVVSFRNNIEEGYCYKKFNNIFCVSNGVKKSFIEKYEIENCCVQYNPVDEIEILFKSNLFEVKRDYNRMQFVTLGRLVEEKGYNRLLRVVLKLKEEGYNNFNVWILGDGCLKDEFSDYIKSNHLENYVSLLGFQENPYPYIKFSDALICSSISEGFSTVATESMILSKPIFTTDCAGMKELFGDYECGVICENKEIELFNMLKDVLTNEYDLFFFKENILKRKIFFTLENRIIEMEKILDE